MRYRICPQCRNLNPEQIVFCLFCGAPFRKRAARIPRESAASPRVRQTFANRAQSAFFLFALVAFALASLFPSISREYAALSAGFVGPTNRTASADPKSALFSRSSGTYAVHLYLSQATSEDASAQSAADDIAGMRLDGDITLAIDETGTGTIQIDQAFFSPKAIGVVAFTDEAGRISDNTLYGTIHQSGMKISIVCVCEEDAISGFIWLDNDLSHVEFLYYS